MRYAIISDIHANLQAWKSTLVDIRANHVDEVICLGDIIGYGPNPAETMKSVYENIDHFILGNHDAATCGKLDPCLFNDNARDLIYWTQSRLNNDAISFLSHIPLSIKTDLFRCTHGDFVDPASYHYILEASDAVRSWSRVDEQVLFVGHTHAPAVYTLDSENTVSTIDPVDFNIKQGMRYVVNVGSVGQPRDRDARASYCIIDTDNLSVIWRRIPFDIDAYISNMEKAGLSLERTGFIKYDPRNNVRPLRESLDFSPPTESDNTSADAEVAENIEAIRKDAYKWKRFRATVLFSILITILCLGAIIWFKYILPSDYDDFTIETNGSSVNHVIVERWRVHMDNRHSQSVKHLRAEDGSPILELGSNSGRKNITITSNPIPVAGNSRFCMETYFMKHESFTGNVMISVDIVINRDNGKELVERFAAKEPSLKRKNGWIAAKHTLFLPTDASSLIFKITGRFSGTVSVKNINLEWK